MSLLVLSDLLTARRALAVREGDIEQLRELQTLLRAHADLIGEDLDQMLPEG